MMKKVNRREFMKITSAAAAGLVIGGGGNLFASEENISQNQRKRTLRIAHMTDVHVQPEKNAESWMVKCLHHIQNLEDKPDIIFNGGDSIMDSLAQEEDRVRKLWDIWKRVLKNECSLPIVHCIGNHDVWGWVKDKSKTNGTEPLYGKKWVLEIFGMKECYQSFDKAGWHFIVLDSTHDYEDAAYTAKLDEKQFQWLKDELEKTDSKTPVCVLSHIPILCACAFFDGDNEKTGNWVVPHQWMHFDARRIKDLFYEHKNVKLCLSGHIHLLDRVDYNGITYLCNGAVSGNWWKGSYQETPPGYAVINLYDDGSFDHEYMTYGWKQAPESP